MASLSYSMVISPLLTNFEHIYARNLIGELIQAQKMRSKQIEKKENSREHSILPSNS